jgi:hypothetical protein
MKPSKKTYEPPRIVRIKLASGELAVAHCKSAQVAPDVCKKGVGLFNKTIGS